MPIRSWVYAGLTDPESSTAHWLGAFAVKTTLEAVAGAIFTLPLAAVLLRYTSVGQLAALLNTPPVDLFVYVGAILGGYSMARCQYPTGVVS